MVGKELEVLIKFIIRQICEEYAGFTLDKEDLLSEGYLIAVEQMKLYKPHTGASMKTYVFSQISYRLRNYVSRVVLKASHGTAEMTRVSMENVDKEVSTSEEHEIRISLDDFRLSLERDERVIFDALRNGYTYREISGELGISTWAITNMVKRWGVMNE